MANLLLTIASVLVPLGTRMQAQTGIGGYDLASPADQIVPFDYDSSGKLDHLLLYRPGSGTV